MSGERIVTPSGKQAVLVGGTRAVFDASGLCEPCCQPCGEADRTVIISPADSWTLITDTFAQVKARIDFDTRIECGGNGTDYEQSFIRLILQCEAADLNVRITVDGAWKTHLIGGIGEPDTIFRLEDASFFGLEGFKAWAEASSLDAFTVCEPAVSLNFDNGNDYEVTVPAGQNRTFTVTHALSFDEGASAMGAVVEATFNVSQA